MQTTTSRRSSIKKTTIRSGYLFCTSHLHSSNIIDLSTYFDMHTHYFILFRLNWDKMSTDSIGKFHAILALCARLGVGSSPTRVPLSAGATSGSCRCSRGTRRQRKTPTTHSTCVRLPAKTMPDNRTHGWTATCACGRRPQTDRPGLTTSLT